jgi:hypothetical protein
MDMKPTSGVNGPAHFIGCIAHSSNLGKTLIALQDRRNELTPRSATLVNTAPFSFTVQIAPIVTSASLKLHAETTLRADFIERSSTATPGVHFPHIGVTIAILAIRITFPAVMLAMHDRTATSGAGNIQGVKAIQAD